VPIYEFDCQTCGEEFEKIQSFSETTTPLCPRCQSTQVQRRMGRPAIHFKGSGWYINDSKSTSKDNAKKAVNGDDKGSSNDSSNDNSAAESTAKTDSSSSSEPKDKPETKEVKETKESKEVAKESAPVAKSAAA